MHAMLLVAEGSIQRSYFDTTTLNAYSDGLSLWHRASAPFLNRGGIQLQRLRLYRGVVLLPGSFHGSLQGVVERTRCTRLQCMHAVIERLLTSDCPGAVAVNAIDVTAADMDFGIDEDDGDESGSDMQLAPRAQVHLTSETKPMMPFQTSSAPVPIDLGAARSAGCEALLPGATFCWFLEAFLSPEEIRLPVQPREH